MTFRFEARASDKHIGKWDVVFKDGDRERIIWRYDWPCAEAKACVRAAWENAIMWSLVR